MKKVIALALAVLMLATVAFAASAQPDTYPGAKITIDKTGASTGSTLVITAKTDGGKTVTFSKDGTSIGTGAETYLPRTINTTNYAITNVKYKMGKGLVQEVKISDTNNRIEIVMADDLSNVKAQDFEVSFKLKGKAKYTLKDSDEIGAYNENQKTEENSYNESKLRDSVNDVNTKVSLPNLDFNVSGTVAYGKYTISLGDDGAEEIENLVAYVRDETTTDLSDDDILNRTIFAFERDIVKAPGTATLNAPMAGAYTADALLTQEYGDALTMEARVYHGDKLYFGIDYEPERDVVNRLADSDGDLDFYKFSTLDKNYTTFNSNVKLYFNDADEDAFVYAINDNGYLVPANGEYSEDDGCWVVKTRTLGRYVVSDVELKDNVVVGGTDANGNPDTGANDVVGIATALAAVALVSAAAISLKK